MTDSKRALIAHLATKARRLNWYAIRARQRGDWYQLTVYLRDQTMGEARAIKGVPSRQRGAELRQALCEIADLSCEIDHQKNKLPEPYRASFTQVVEAAHGHVKTIADYHGLVVYADQEQKKGMLS